MVLICKIKNEIGIVKVYKIERDEHIVRKVSKVVIEGN